jgi:hypothetical protein
VSLEKAVDNLLAYVEAHWRTPDYGNRLPQVNALDTAVYVEARRLGLQNADLPRKDATFYSEEIVFFGRTNVPGCWSSPPDAPSTLRLMATQGWKADMLALRALADAGFKTEAVSSERTKEPRRLRLTVDLPGKMLTLNDVVYPVGSERALRWVKILADRSPAWISSKELKGLDQDLLAERTDKFKKSLPQAVLDLIDSQPGAGSRIRLNAT